MDTCNLPLLSGPSRSPSTQTPKIVSSGCLRQYMTGDQAQVRISALTSAGVQEFSCVQPREGHGSWMDIVCGQGLAPESREYKCRNYLQSSLASLGCKGD